MLEMDLYAEIGQGGTLLENLAPHQKQIATIAKKADYVRSRKGFL